MEDGVFTFYASPTDEYTVPKVPSSSDRIEVLITGFTEDSILYRYIDKDGVLIKKEQILGVGERIDEIFNEWQYTFKLKEGLEDPLPETGSIPSMVIREICKSEYYKNEYSNDSVLLSEQAKFLLKDWLCDTANLINDDMRDFIADTCQLQDKPRGDLYRGTVIKKEDLAEGNRLKLTPMTSWSTDMNVSKSFKCTEFDEPDSELNKNYRFVILVLENPSEGFDAVRFMDLESYCRWGWEQEWILFEAELEILKIEGDLVYVEYI